MKQLAFTLFVLLSTYNYGQNLSSCKNYSSFSASDPRPFTTPGSCVIIDQNLQIQNDNEFNLANNVTIHIAPNKTFYLSVNNLGASNNFAKFVVEGNLNLSNPTINTNILVDVKNTGIVNTANVKFNGSKNTITNAGVFRTSVIEFSNSSSVNSITNQNSFITDNFNVNGIETSIVNQKEFKLKQLDLKTANSTNTIENSTNSTMLIDGNINITGTSRFKNSGQLTINANYNNNDKSIYINCGVIDAKVGFNLEGGRVVNTGSFIHGTGTINLGSKGSIFENFGNLVSNGTVEVKGEDVLYNEGYIQLKNSTIDGGKLLGPLSINKKGYFHLINSLGGNNPKIGPNLVFSRDLPTANYIKSYTRNYNDLTNKVTFITNSAINQIDANIVINSTTASYPNDITYNNCPSIIGEFTNTNENTPACKKVPKTGTPASYTTIGISTLDDTQLLQNQRIAGSKWPYDIPNGSIALQSKSKGLVLTRTTEAKINKPVEGMLIYDTEKDCIKLYNGEKWNCITKSCNE